MQNFTLGKKGIMYFFFAFLLMNGTYSYGQSCPVADPIQYFCDSQEAEIGDLTVTSGTNVQWYSSQTATTPLSMTQFLVNGTTYYAGTDGSCENNRAAVTVSIASQPEILGIRSSSATPTAANKQSLTIIGICVADINNPGLTVGDLRTNAADEDAVRWYYNRTDTTPIPTDTELINNTDYYASIVSADGNCETNRRKTTVQFFSEPAPTGDTNQEFCAIDNPTLSDIVASGNNRYFSTSDSETELSPNTALVNGRTYYLSAVGENCESIDRLPVTVTVIPPTDLGTPEPGIICELEVNEVFPSIDAIKNYYLSLLDPSVPRTGTLNPSASQLATMYQNDADGLGDFTTTYTVGCDQVDLTVSIIPSQDANAGEDVNPIDLDLNDSAINLYDYITGEGAILTGSFQEYPDGTFDPAIEGEGTYTVTYLVDETSGCIVGSDSAIFTIVVAPCTANAGADVDASYCRSEAEALAAQFLAASTEEERDAILAAELGNRDTDGTFSGDPGAELAAKYMTGIYPFSVTTTYTAGEGVCEDQAEIKITVYEDVNAGESTTLTLNPDDAPVDLFALLGPNAQSGGTWNMGNGTFNPASDAPGTYTYTVGTGCTDSASIVIAINSDPTTPGITPGYTIVCLADVQTFFPSIDEIRKFYLRLLPSGVATNGTFNPSPSQLASMYQADEDGLGEFTTVYTVNAQSYELTVNIVTEANAGESTTITVSENDDPVDLFAKLGPNAQKGGTWSSGNGTFDPATDAAGTFTYTVGYETCMDSATVTVNVTTEPTDPVDPGTVSPGYTIICEADVQTFFPSIDEIRKFYLRLLPEGVATNGTFNPSPSQLADMYQADEDGLGEFTTVYTVNAQSYELTVNIVTEANAGESTTITVSENDDPVDLFAKLGPNAQEGGTWSSGNGTFDPATDAAGTFTYTVGYETCTDSATVTVNVTTEPTDPCEGVVNAGTDSSTTLCETDVQATFPSIDEIRKFYLDLLDSGVARTGTLNPTASQLATMYQNDADGLGDFTTIYTLTNGECSASVELKVTIVAAEEANAGAIGNFQVCSSASPLNLYSRLAADSSPGGKFYNATGNEIADGSLDISVADDYVITYTVSEGEACVTGTDSVQFTVTVVDNTVDAGADNSKTVCNSEVRSLSATGVRNLYLGLLESGVDQSGTFNPTIQQLIDQYNLQSNFGDFKTEYTIGSGDCTDSVELTVTVLENPDAGQNGTLNFAIGETDAKDLFTGLNGTPEAGGTWTDSDGNEVDGSFDPTTDTPGVYTYTLTNANDCSASATVTVTVEQDTTACPDVTDTTPDFCPGATVAQLEPADANWYDTADGTTPLSDDTALTNGGVYYAGDAAGECPARVMVTVTILDAPAAPTVADFSDCVITGATVSDLDITPDTDATFTVYTDAALLTPAADTDVLIDGTYYVTQTSAAGCESPAAELDVTLTDSNAPTLVAGGNVFCEFDRATLADLEENVTANGTITWYTTETGDETYSTSEVLSNNVTYYASVTPNGDCESSQRLGVTVILESCDIVIPEIFSPNGDSINDTFVVKNLAAEYPNHKMEIYNRWGEPVYKGNASTPAWDGTSTEGSFGDGVLPVGVYFYVIYFNDGQTAPVQGRLYLSR